ncbi:hypothetical protein ACMC3T_001407 [Campylobacter coli]|nr:hypothetical protein [Campylobacter coli]HEB9289397.1 hypothetical protein [Campylobacter coli]
MNKLAILFVGLFLCFTQSVSAYYLSPSLCEAWDIFHLGNCDKNLIWSDEHNCMINADDHSPYPSCVWDY